MLKSSLFVSLTINLLTHPCLAAAPERAGAAAAAVATTTPESAAQSPAPAAPHTQVRVRAPLARLRLRASEPGVSYYVKAAMATAGTGLETEHATGYNLICVAPCEAELPEGTYTLALGKGDSPPVPAKPMRISGTQTLYGKLTLRAGTRVGGWVLALGSLGLGAALVASARSAESNCAEDAAREARDADCTRDEQRGAAATIGIGGGITGLVLALQPDRAEIGVQQSRAAARRSRKVALRTIGGPRRDGGYDAGLALRLRF